MLVGVLIFYRNIFHEISTQFPLDLIISIISNSLRLFLWWTGTELSITSSSSNDDLASLYTICKALPCISYTFYGTSKLKDNCQMRHDKRFHYYLEFVCIQSWLTWWLKCNFESNTNIWYTNSEAAIFVVNPSSFALNIKKWYLSSFDCMRLFENHLDNYSVSFLVLRV